MKNIVFICMIIFLAACTAPSDVPASVEAVQDAAEQSVKTVEKVNNRFEKQGMIFSISQTGGCMMAGPNCAEYRLNIADGSFELLRIEEDSVIEKKGKLDVELVDAWFLELNKIENIEDFAQQLGEGECRACFDGIDLSYNVVNDRFSILSLSSQEKNFDKALPFFSLSDQLYREMGQHVQLDMKMRR